MMLPIEQIHWQFISIGGGLLLILILFLILYRRDKKLAKIDEVRLEFKRNALKIYMLDLIHNTVLCFSRSRIREKTAGGIDIFYQQFHPSERERIIQWFYDLLADKPDTPSYLEADIIGGQGDQKKHPFFLLLQVYKVDREHKRIYLESTILRSVHPRVKIRKRRKRYPTMITSEARMRAYFERNKDHLRGTTTLFRFYKLNYHQTSTLPLEHQLAVVLQDKLIGFLGNGRYLLAFSDMEIAVFDVKSLGRSTALEIARAIASEMAAYLDINGLKENYSFSIGIAENKGPFADYDSLIEGARTAAILAEESGKKIAFYEGGPQSTPTENKVFSLELESLIKQRKINVAYRPIVDVRKGAPMGYIAYLEPYDSLFNNIRELREYAYKANQHQELFSLLGKKAIPRFYAQRGDQKQKLFFPVSVIDDYAINKLLSRINHSKDVNLVLTFAEEEVGYSLKDIEVFSERLNNYNQLGHEVAVRIQDATLTLPSSMYRQFDYFLIDHRMVKRLKTDERRRTHLSSVLEKLIKYNKPIVITDLDNWAAIQLVIQMGINLISSDEISMRSEMILPVENKKIKRLNSFAD
ncbi:MAG: EAL domain-containing protein [Bacilli bacterium]